MAGRKPVSPRTRARIDLGRHRIRNILRRQGVANMRTLEQKIADAGPFNQRVEPIHLTTARIQLERDGEVDKIHAGNSQGADWYFLTETPHKQVDERLHELLPVWDAFTDHDLKGRSGDALEVAIFKSLRAQDYFLFNGHFVDADTHDDSLRFVKKGPLPYFSGRTAPGELDFHLISPTGVPLGLEAKNIRAWLYPRAGEIRHLLKKCCALRMVPVLIARRIPYVAFSEVFRRCGILVHQTYNQLLANADRAVAEQARHKDLLGYHDIRLGNEPDTRLNRFIHDNLPSLVDEAQERFFDRFEMLEEFAYGLPYSEFIAKLRGTWNDPDTLTDEDWRALREDLGF